MRETSWRIGNLRYRDYITSMVSLMADRKSPIQRLYYFHGGVQNITSATPEGEVSLMADRKSPVSEISYPP
jgi:hypothetical protein